MGACLEAERWPSGSFLNISPKQRRPTRKTGISILMLARPARSSKKLTLQSIQAFGGQLRLPDSSLVEVLEGPGEGPCPFPNLSADGAQVWKGGQRSKEAHCRPTQFDKHGVRISPNSIRSYSRAISKHVVSVTSDLPLPFCSLRSCILVVMDHHGRCDCCLRHHSPSSPPPSRF